jgi:hypothetical protein
VEGDLIQGQGQCSGSQHSHGINSIATTSNQPAKATRNTDHQYPGEGGERTPLPRPQWSGSDGSATERVSSPCVLVPSEAESPNT